jgi:hypothetical protein
VQINAVAYYVPVDSVPASLRVYMLVWETDGLGAFVTNPATGSGIGVVFTKLGPHPAPVKSVQDLEYAPDGFCSLLSGMPWEDPDSEYASHILTAVVSSTLGTITVPVRKYPYPIGDFSAVFLQAAKLGVLAMGSQNEPLDTVIHRVTDQVRNALQVVPGSSNAFYQTTTPATENAWTGPYSFTFESVAFAVHNFGVVSVEFSLDGVNPHGIIPAGKWKVYDFRRATQIYIRASDPTAQVVIEAW